MNDIIAIITTFSLIISSFLWTEISIKNITSSKKYVAEVLPCIIKKKIFEMGSGYDYKLIGYKLYVDKGDGNWLRLRY